MSWLPSPIVLASIGFGTYVVTVGGAAVITAWWLVLLARWSWRRLRPARRTRRHQAAPKRIPAPDRQPARADLDAVFPKLAAQIRRLNSDIDAALTAQPTSYDIQRLIEGATNACRDAANHKS